MGLDEEGVVTDALELSPDTSSPAAAAAAQKFAVPHPQLHERFEKIYRDKEWTGEGNGSGHGSSLSWTEGLRK